MCFFKDRHPLSLAVYFLSVIIFTVFSSSPIITLVSLAGASVCLILNSGITAFLKKLKFYLPFFLLVTVTNPIFVTKGKTLLFTLFGRKFTLEALIYGLFTSVVIVSAMLWLNFFGSIFGKDKAMYLLSGKLPKTALLISSVIRFIPLMKSRIKAEKDIFISLSGKSKLSLKDYGKILLSVLSRSLEDGIITAESMNARGYGDGKRISYARFSFAFPDAVLLMFTVLSDIFLIISFGILPDFAYYPTVDAIPNTPLDIAVYSVFAILIMIPVINESEATLRWKSCVSKI